MIWLWHWQLEQVSSASETISLNFSKSSALFQSPDELFSSMTTIPGHIPHISLRCNMSVDKCSFLSTVHGFWSSQVESQYASLLTQKHEDKQQQHTPQKQLCNSTSRFTSHLGQTTETQNVSHTETIQILNSAARKGLIRYVSDRGESVLSPETSSGFHRRRHGRQRPCPPQLPQSQKQFQSSGPTR
jgi:hypothetical protein